MTKNIKQMSKKELDKEIDAISKDLKNGVFMTAFIEHWQSKLAELKAERKKR